MRPLVEIARLRVVYELDGGWAKSARRVVSAVDGVSFQIHEGETLGLVGESGCGKSTLGKAILRLVDPVEGRVRFDGEDLGGLSPVRLRAMRRRMQMVFQDPASSLNPRMTVGDAVSEPLVVHRLCGAGETWGRLVSMLASVGLSEDFADRFPHELSGGQRQLVAIARALATGPRFVVADEPLSGLDGSVQAQIANLLVDLQEQLGLTYLFVSHDLRMVAHLADRIAVMYLGRIVELGPVELVGPMSSHPYARALLAASARGSRRDELLVEGEVPSPLSPPAGCRFHPRCPFARERCRREEPGLSEVSNGHSVACFWPLEPGREVPVRQVG